MRLLVTRPEQDAARTAQTLQAHGHSVILAPLMTIEPMADVALGTGSWSALLLTSANAVHALAAHPRAAEIMPLPVFAVGRRTADAAREAGFATVASADGNVDGLAELVASRLAGSDARLLYLAAEDRAGDLAAALAARGIVIETIVIYRAAAAGHFPKIASDALASGEVDGVLHFSRRSAEIYLQCAEADGLLAQALAPRHYCLSNNVGQPLMAAGAAHVEVARQPNEAGLIALISV